MWAPAVEVVPGPAVNTHPFQIVAGPPAPVRAVARPVTAQATAAAWAGAVRCGVELGRAEPGGAVGQ